MTFFTRIVQSLEGVAIAFESIRSNKIRAALTIFGVAVGVFVVVAMAAAVHGITASFQKDLNAFGATSFQVRRRGINLGGCDGTDESCPERRNPAITRAEAAMLRQLPSVQAVTEIWGDAKPFRYKDKYLRSVGYDALSAEWMETDDGDIAPGRNFSAQEEEAAARVAIINDTLKARLFGDSDPIGKQITIDDQPFTVIGIYHTSAGFLKTMDGRGPDRPRAIIPFGTARRHLSLWWRGVVLMVRPRAGYAQSDVMDDVTAALRARRGLRPAQPNNFALVTQARMMEVFDKLFGTLFIIGLTLSAVGLLVGGVGVVAIMMISVTERTREIGVRKALGATKGTILLQFLIESVTLTGIGALAGLTLGWLIALAVRQNTPIPTEVPVWAALMALGASAVTGIAFGMVPAARAARLDPVEALRHE
jgi:putative ABC transport system permease protein